MPKRASTSSEARWIASIWSAETISKGGHGFFGTRQPAWAIVPLWRPASAPPRRRPRRAWVSALTARAR